MVSFIRICRYVYELRKAVAVSGEEVSETYSTKILAISLYLTISSVKIYRKEMQNRVYIYESIYIESFLCKYNQLY